MEKRQFKINLPADVDGWVEAEAKQNCRSKAGQIVFALRSAMAAGGDLAGQTPAAGNENAAFERGAV
ncbi:hypothetical protein [Paracoccus haematequi]|uniref:hypothetical protein n=1 Tax=Paracoccus haematequi TaxID=2491866 RepID=UPI000F7EC43A|nr:hypothetical protein [Paracoccus haematequi]